MDILKNHKLNLIYITTLIVLLYIGSAHLLVEHYNVFLILFFQPALPIVYSIGNPHVPLYDYIEYLL